ncbi:branched chain amino acid aminotransferase [Paucibacter sp. KBW04]|uniref:branched-chain amino acid transaminase n=1 Tax=Paucibacter sp. KBW04 TaxID=2153361 RepID=UPI000F578645|nr:branched-chain amino acid transaminase [Paucibacter sp. KBW04]RQO59711.1 branched chain amino acid aminotransferase [Paucibacter sp. KBW04]
MAAITESEWIWKDGQLIPWHQAQLHLLSTAVQFGTSMFEGIRCYDTPEGPAIFRLHEHLRRLQDSCRVFGLESPHDIATLAAACLSLVAKNKLGSCYLRPMVLLGYGGAGLSAEESPIETYIAAWPWGTYLGEGALEKGVDACISSWQRAHPNTYPLMAKAGGQYLNSQLMKWEALRNGYQEAIGLSPSGLVSEGTGMNIFVVWRGRCFTPALDGTLLPGITADSVMQLAREIGIDIEPRQIPREMLYGADEIFFTGTAAELTPVASVDRCQIGSGRTGPITKALQQQYLDYVKGKVEDRHGWRTLVPSAL